MTAATSRTSPGIAPSRRPTCRFNLSNGAGFDTNKTTNDDGKIRYTDLAPGNNYVLTEDLPGDALDNRVAYCATDGADYIEYGVAGDGSIDLDPIADGDQVQCLWYNVPVDQNVGSGSLEIHKSECPPGTTSNFYTTCHEDVVGGIGFDVDGPGSYSNTGTTNDNGILVFTDLPIGQVHCLRDCAGRLPRRDLRGALHAGWRGVPDHIRRLHRAAGEVRPAGRRQYRLRLVQHPEGPGDLDTDPGRRHDHRDHAALHRKT